MVGFLIMGAALFLLTAGRDALIVLWANKLFDGEIDTLFKAAQTADKVIDHTLKVLLFVGLSFIKLGIGFAIATIVRNLRATGQSTLDTYSAAGVAEADAARFTEPWFGRYFTWFLFGGLLVVLFFFVIALWWDANLVLLKRAEFAGHTSGAAYETYVMTERILDPLIGAGKFVGEALLILGIAMGLAAIIANLSFQARALPQLTRRALRDGGTGSESEPIRPQIPAKLVSLAIAGASVIALALPLGIIRSGFIGWAVNRQLDGLASPLALRVEGILGRIIDPLINLGLGMLFVAIAFLLLTIIRWLREQRRGFGIAVADLSDGVISRPSVESSLWPQRFVAPLAISGLFIIVFFFAVAGIRADNFDGMLSLQASGAADTVLFQNAKRLDEILKPVIGATRFIGVGTVMLAIGMALVTIVVHLRATALLLPVGFSQLIPIARGERPEGEDLTLSEPMYLAPWNLLRPHQVGLAILVSATLPVIIVYAVSIHRNFVEQFAGRGEAGAMSGLFKSSFLSVQLINASWQPWMLFGMALILYAIGGFFTTIVGFVEARRMVIAEGTQAIAEAVRSDSRERIPSREKVPV